MLWKVLASLLLILDSALLPRHKDVYYFRDVEWSIFLKRWGSNFEPNQTTICYGQTAEDCLSVHWLVFLPFSYTYLIIILCNSKPVCMWNMNWGLVQRNVCQKIKFWLLYTIKVPLSKREVELVLTSKLPSKIVIKTQDIAWTGDSDLIRVSLSLE